MIAGISFPYTLPLTPNSRLGPYEVLSLLGSGGMGEVYQAKDTRLDRTVAIKVLLKHLSSDSSLRERFDREARAISSLTHPHICALYDIGHQDGLDYLVMEYLEGESMADRVARGPLPVDQVLRYGIEIADALDKAHRQGLVHRDLKPGNIMLTKLGAKLLDFGLVKYTTTEELGQLTNLPTENRPLTQEGTILGTFQYMAPEQLEGREADARTDIFAFGAVLYEAATGRRAFHGASKASLIASIISGNPEPISVVQPLTPPALERVVQVCLAKDPDDRWQSAHDIAEELRWISEAGSQAGVASVVISRRKNRERLWLTAAIVVSLAAIALGGMLLKARSVVPRSLHASFVPAVGVSMSISQNDAASLTLSPDGRYLTFSGETSDSKKSLWLDRLDTGEMKPIIGTENGYGPFWSPDSRSLGFFAGGKLKKIDVNGGPAIALADAADGRGGTWSRDGIILFAGFWRDAIHRVSASGGAVTVVTRVDEEHGETTHRWPLFLPDGKRFIYLAGTHRAGTESELNGVYLSTLGSPGRKLLLRARSNVVLSGDYLLFVRNQYLLAQKFDMAKESPTGEPIRLAENVAEQLGFFRAVFGASDDGTLAYATGSASTKQRLLIFDRTAHSEQLAPPDDYLDGGLRLSPDGKRLAMVLGDPPDIWILDIARGARTRFTSHPMSDFLPTWSPDGKQIVFASDRRVGDELYIKRVDGLTQEQPFKSVKEGMLVPEDWSSDGRFIAAQLLDAKNPDGTGDIWIVPATGDAKPYPFIATEFKERAPLFSPDAKWLAFTSDETGKDELYVVPFPDRGEKRQLSTTGVTYFVWPPKGHEILYTTLDQTLMSIDFSHGQFGDPKPLFKFPALPVAFDSIDGQKIIVALPEKHEGAHVSIVTNALPR